MSSQPCPFEIVYNELLKMLRDSEAFNNLVREKNLIAFNTSSRDPVKRNMATADTPEVMLATTGLTVNMNASSSHSRITRRYEWLITTGDLRVGKDLFPLEWAILEGMLNWKRVLVPLLWKDEQFVTRCDGIEATEGLVDPERNRGILGWSSVWACSVQMDIRTTSINPLAFD